MTEALTWRELSAVDEGTRVRFVSPWDIFPITVVEVGTVGTLVRSELNEISSLGFVLPDDRELRAMLRDWDGEIYLSPEPWDAAWDEASPVALAD
jgi:hypothetical protein